MIQLNDLSKELTEVQNSDLGLVVGGGSFSQGLSGLKSTNNLSNLVIKSEGNLSQPFGSNNSSVSYTTSGGYGFGADTSGTFSVKAPLGNDSNVSTQYNFNSGNYKFEANWSNPF